MTSSNRRDEERLIARLEADARTIGAPFGLQARSIGKTRRDARILGCCDTEGAIRIRLRSRTTGAFLKYSSLIATLCHELAHLRHFTHGPAFTRLYQRLLESARRQGLYCPSAPHPAEPETAPTGRRPDIAARTPALRSRTRRPADPRQLTLFSAEELRELREDAPPTPGPASHRAE